MIIHRKLRPDAPKGTMSEALLQLLRQRVSSGYYDRPELVDAIARAIHSRAA